MSTDQEIPEILRKQLSDAGKKGWATKKLTRKAQARGGRKAMKQISHEERVRRGKMAWQKRLERARALAASMAQEAKTV